MVNYDQFEWFVDYMSKDTWRNYIESQVIPLWRDTLILKEFLENLRNEFQNLPLARARKLRLMAKTHPES